MKLQLAAAKSLSHPRSATTTLIGSGFVRRPKDATPRYTHWLNNLTQCQLMTQRFREVHMRCMRVETVLFNRNRRLEKASKLARENMTDREVFRT